MAEKTIIIGNDHVGYSFKLSLINYLQENGYTGGCHRVEIVRYPHFASAVAGAVVSGEAARAMSLS